MILWKYLKISIGTFHGLCIGNDFFGVTPKRYHQKAGLSKWDYIKRIFYQTEWRGYNRDQQNRRKYSQTICVIKYSKYVRNKSYEIHAKDPIKQFPKEVQMLNKYIKKCSVSLAISEMKITTIIRYDVTQRMSTSMWEKGSPDTVARHSMNSQ